MEPQLQGYRTLFPVTEQYSFLNNAAESPLNIRVKQAMEEYLCQVAAAPQNKPEVRKAVRDRLARIMGGQARNYALMTSTGHGITTVANGIGWVKGDNVVLPYDEHWNNNLPWLALEARGVELRFVHPDADNRLPLSDFARQIDARTRVVTLAAVRFNSGLRTDLRAVGALAREAGALFVVDGIQAAGAVPLDVVADGIDVLCCAGFKWLLGMPGTGFMYVSDSAQQRIAPSAPGMFAAENRPDLLRYFDDARRYETGSLAYALFHSWQQGLDLVAELGVETIHRRNLYLTDRLIAGIDTLGWRILSPHAATAERSAILVFSVGDSAGNERLVRHLAENGVIIALRAGLCRISPNFYNSDQDIERFLTVAREAVQRGL